MNPILKYFLNLSAFQRVVGNSDELKGLAKTEALLSDLVGSKKVPGISITALKNGSVWLQKGYGFADIERQITVDPTKTVFRIASVSKNIAATALAHMVADGQIDLDASLYDYVPYFPKKKWDFTIRQLAGHTAGIRGYRGAEYGLNEPYSIKDSLSIFKDDELLFKPGTDYFYNSYGWVLIALAIQEVSGIPFEKYVQEKVLSPLGMKNTFAEYVTSAPLSDRNTNEMVAERSRSYTKNRLGGFRAAIPVNNYYKLAGGGYLSTSEDIAKFGQAYLDNKVLDKALLSEFLTTQIVNGTPTYYGLGWQLSQDAEGRRYYGHVGNGVGGYSNFFVYPDQQMVFAILLNCTDPKIQNELDEVVNAMLTAIPLLGRG